MKTLSVTFGLWLGLAVLAPVAKAADTASLTVTFKGLTARQGAVMFVVVNSAEAYADKAKPVAQGMLPVGGEATEVSQTFSGLAPGRYAIKAFHDVNGDGKMGANPFGIPNEPYAFSNNAVGAMAPPKWEAAGFDVKAGDNIHTITID